jgi:hypothetical protein
VGDGASLVVAGYEQLDHFGVGLGPLPGSLASIAAMVASSNQILLVASENSLLRIQLGA